MKNKKAAQHKYQLLIAMQSSKTLAASCQKRIEYYDVRWGFNVWRNKYTEQTHTHTLGVHSINHDEKGDVCERMCALMNLLWVRALELFSVIRASVLELGLISAEQTRITSYI